MARQERARVAVIVGFDAVGWEVALLLATGGEKDAGVQRILRNNLLGGSGEHCRLVLELLSWEEGRFMVSRMLLVSCTRISGGRLILKRMIMLKEDLWDLLWSAVFL